MRQLSKLIAKPVFISVTFLLLSVIGVTVLLLPTFEINPQKQYNDVYKETTNIATKISNAIHTSVNMSQALASFIENDTGLTQKDFSKFVNSMLRNDNLKKDNLKNNNIVKSMTYSKNFKINFIAPYDDESKKNIGSDLMSNPEKIPYLMQSIKTKNIYIEGPLKLTHSEDYGFIFFIPVWNKNDVTNENKTNNKLLGIVSLIILCEKFYEVTELTKTTVIDIALKSEYGIGNYGSVFYGDSTIFQKENAIKISIELANNYEWILAAYPQNGGKTGIPIIFISSYFIALLFSFGIYTVMVKYKLNQIKENERRYRYITEKVNYIIWTIDIETMRYTFTSDVCYKLTGYTIEEYYKMSIADTLTPESVEKAMRILNENIASAKPEDKTIEAVFEVQQKTKSGEIQWIEVSAISIRKSNGKFQEIIGVSRVIDDRKKLEQQLIEREKKYRLLTENMRDIVWTMDVETLKYRFVSGACRKMFGFETDEYLQMTAKETLSPDSYKLLAEYINIDATRYKRGANSAIERTMELQQYHKNGYLIWTEVSGKMLLDRNGNLSIIATSRNIEERKKVEAALKESEAKYKMIIQNTRDIIWAIDFETQKYTFINEICEEITGFNVDEYLNMTLKESVPPEFYENIMELINSKIKEYKTGDSLPQLTHEVQLYNKSGGADWVEVYNKILTDDNGKFTQLVGVTRNINDRKAAQLKILEQKKKLEELNAEKELILDNINDMICRISLPAFNFVYVAGACYNILGYTPEEYTQLSIKDVTPPESFQSIRKAIDMNLTKYQHGEIDHHKPTLEIQQYRKDGSLVWVEISGRAVLNEKNGITEIVAILRNIEERKIAELKILEQKEKLEKLNVEQEFILNNVNDIITIVDVPTFNFTFTTSACYNIFGYTPEEYVQMSIKDVMTPESYKSLTELTLTDLDKHKRGEITDHPVLTFEIQLYHKNGSLVWVEVSSKAIFNEKNGHSGIIAIIRSIEERKAAQLKILEQKEELEKQKEELERQNEKLGELNATKDKFFSIIAHDLKNPFSALLNISEILSKEYDDMEISEVKESIILLSNSAKHLYNLLENLLEWSRCSRGEIAYNPTKNNINEIIYNSVNNLRGQANVKNINIQAPDAFANKNYVFCDVNMIHTVMNNLVTNAIKFSFYDSIVEISVADYSDDSNYFQVSIKDSGVGINENDIEKLFRIDKKITTKGTAQEKGTGLGLIICKEFIDKHNCKIWLTSVKGKGTTFFFTLPKAQ